VTEPIRKPSPVGTTEIVSAPAKKRTFFWPAFAIAFLLWALASCGGVAAFVGLDEFRLTDFQPSAAVWTPPPLATQAVAVDAPPATTDETPTEPTRFQPGGRAQNATSSRVNIRNNPGYLGQVAADILAQMNPGETVEILGWPRNADNLIWWPIRYQAADGTLIEGWVAESTASGVQILTPLP
jgi:hypothetical protein